MIYSSYRKNKKKYRNFTRNQKHEANVFGIDELLLRTLLTIQSPSGYEIDMITFIEGWLSENVPNAIVTRDKYSNLYVAKITEDCEFYPCIVAHTDEVCGDSDER